MPKVNVVPNSKEYGCRLTPKLRNWFLRQIVKHQSPISQAIVFVNTRQHNNAKGLGETVTVNVGLDENAPDEKIYTIFVDKIDDEIRVSVEGIEDPTPEVQESWNSLMFQVKGLLGGRSQT